MCCIIVLGCPGYFPRMTLFKMTYTLQHYSLSFTLLLLIAVAISVDGEFQSLDNLQPQASDKIQTRAVADLLKRLLGSRAREFKVLVNRTLANGNLEVCELRSARNNRIAATGSTGVALATGIYNYLKYFCNCHVSWSGSQLNIPRPLPAVTGVLRINTQHRYVQESSVVF